MDLQIVVLDGEAAKVFPIGVEWKTKASQSCGGPGDRMRFIGSIKLVVILLAAYLARQ